MKLAFALNRCTSTVVMWGTAFCIASTAHAQTLLTADHIRLLIVGRIAERLAVLAAAILSMTFGFLSLRTASVEQGNIEASARNVFSFKLHNVGPGVFFALFGAALLLWSLNTKLDLQLPSTVTAAASLPDRPTPRPTAETPKSEDARVSYGFGIPELTDAKERRRLLSAILTSESLTTRNRPALNGRESRNLSKAIDNLEPLKAAIVDSEVGYVGAYQWWQKVKNDPKYGSPDFEDRFSTKERSDLHAIDGLMRDSLGEEQ
jgi:hypothetical protein